MLLKDLQLKGSGRSPLALRTDYHHTWGGQYFWQSLKAYIVSHILEGALPQGILSTPLISVPTSELENKRLSHSLNSLMVREADDLRVTQVATDFDQELKPTKLEIKQSVLKEANSKTFEELFQKIIFQYASMALLGLRHIGVTRENIMVKGSLIDYEDRENHNSQEGYYFHYMTKVKNNSSPKDAKLFTSTLHFYLEALILTAHGLNFLGAKISPDRLKLKKVLMKEIYSLSQTVFIVDQELLTFMDKILDLIPGYDRDIQKYAKDATKISKLKHQIQLSSGEIVKEEKGFDELILNQRLKFPRIEFRNPLLQAFQNHKNQTSILELTQKMFKMVEIETFGRNPTFEMALDLSSKVHEKLCLEQLVFPYQLKSKKINLKYGKLDDILLSYQNLGMKVLELVIFYENDTDRFKTEKFTLTKLRKLRKCEFILLGIKVQLPYKKKTHFLTQPGILIKMK